MNPTTDDDIPTFTDPAHEREWLAQEHAMRREHLHLDPTTDDAHTQRYRLLTRVLREPQPDGLPTDFAQQLANEVASASANVVDTRFERVLTTSLGAALLLAAIVVSVLYGSNWLSAIGASVPIPPPGASRWLLALSACIGMSWLVGLWQRPRLH
ncbi:MAG: hypothetical protein ABI178_04080 [Rhodanobacter sp.]